MLTKALLVLLSVGVFSVVDLSSPPNEPERGCCSHHGGVCGCAGSRARCCDGSVSPSCGC